MSETKNGPKEPPKPVLGTIRAANPQAADFNRLGVIVDDAIRLYVSYNYDVPLNRCRNYEEILGWVHHLTSTEKWMTPKLAGHFIRLACEANWTEVPPIWPG